MVINFSCLIWRSLILLVVYAAPCQAALVLSQGTNLNADVSAINGRIAIDLLGNIWSVPANGGQAKILSDHLLPASRPRWSLDGTHILHQTQTSNKSQVWIIDLKSTKSSKISDGMYFDQHPEWHPDGERIIFSSVRGATGFDIWEMHLPTGRAWKTSNHPGDETEPVWSADGQHLAYIQHYDNRWSLILRRNGQPEHEIVVSTEPLSAPSWRPDGSLLTFLRKTDSGLSVEMVILSNPPLIRQFITGEDGIKRIYINVWGHVKNPGNHLVFDGIDLPTLLSVVGGPLSGANLKWASFLLADLSHVNISNIVLDGTNFLKTNLSGVDFTDLSSIPSGVIFKGSNLTNSNFEGINLAPKEPYFQIYKNRADLKNLDWHDLTKELFGLNYNILITSKEVQGNDLVVNYIYFNSFAKANLENANFKNTKLWNANFYLANLTNADLSGADLRKAFFSEADLSNANLKCINHPICESN